MNFDESDEQQLLRESVAKLGQSYGHDYFVEASVSGGDVSGLWREAGELGYLGVNIPERYGGSGLGIVELSIVLEELAAAGCPLLMLVVSPAICGTVISRFGTDEQRERWLQGLADGSRIMAFAITESEAGSNSHRIATVARSDGDGWVLSGRKTYISGIDVADDVLVVGRLLNASTGRLEPALFVVPVDAEGLKASRIEMVANTPDHQYELFLDDVRLPAHALIGNPDEHAGLSQLFAGLNPERIMAASYGLGIARYALDKAVGYARERTVWDVPIGAHQGISHPLAQVYIEIELARLMRQKAAVLYDDGRELEAGGAANMAKYAAAEACVHAVDQAVQTLGGHGLSREHGVGTMLGIARAIRIAPVSREMILNFVAQHHLGLPKSY